MFAPFSSKRKAYNLYLLSPSFFTSSMIDKKSRADISYFLKKSSTISLTMTFLSNTALNLSCGYFLTTSHLLLWLICSVKPVDFPFLQSKCHIVSFFHPPTPLSLFEIITVLVYHASGNFLSWFPEIYCFSCVSLMFCLYRLLPQPSTKERSPLNG